jgi:shikimate dehydrogenase
VTARQAGVLGRPIEHSLSPVLHRAAYAALGLPWVYHALDCGVEELPGVLAARADWAGFSATMPLKHAALDVAAEVSDLAAAVGAANTLLPVPGGWRADNTDVTGVAAALRPHVTGRDVMTVLGGGGTAQAAVAAAQQLGLAGCTVLLRDPARADRVLGTAERVGIGVTVGRLAPDTVELRERVVVSALPPGAADPLADRHWRPGQVVLDVVYAGWPTPLAAAAGAAGATVLSGAAVLLFQAAAQLTLMTGRDAPVEAMRAALLAAAPGCGA